MKYLLSIICFSICFSCANAQLSIGLRGGVYYQFGLGQTWYGPSHSGIHWRGDEPSTELGSELYANYKVKRWLFGLGYMRFKNTVDYSSSFEGFSYFHNEYIRAWYHSSVVERSHYFNTSVAYDCSFWKNKKLRGYLGIGISPVYNTHNGEDYELINNREERNDISGHEWELRVGLLYTAIYQLNTQTCLVADVAMRTSGMNPFPDYTANTLLSGQLGISYRITR